MESFTKNIQNNRLFWKLCSESPQVLELIDLAQEKPAAVHLPSRNGGRGRITSVSEKRMSIMSIDENSEISSIIDPVRNFRKRASTDISARPMSKSYLIKNYISQLLNSQTAGASLRFCPEDDGNNLNYATSQSLNLESLKNSKSLENSEPPEYCDDSRRNSGEEINSNKIIDEYPLLNSQFHKRKSFSGVTHGSKNRIQSPYTHSSSQPLAFQRIKENDSAAFSPGSGSDHSSSILNSDSQENTNGMAKQSEGLHNLRTELLLRRVAAQNKIKLSTEKLLQSRSSSLRKKRESE